MTVGGDYGCAGRGSRRVVGVVVYVGASARGGCANGMRAPTTANVFAKNARKVAMAEEVAKSCTAMVVWMRVGVGGLCREAGRWLERQRRFA